MDFDIPISTKESEWIGEEFTTHGEKVIPALMELFRMMGRVERLTPLSELNFQADLELKKILDQVWESAELEGKFKPEDLALEKTRGRKRARKSR
nr:hypothetical protein [Candidatus Sigynarchaeota archaeon]